MSVINEMCKKNILQHFSGGNLWCVFHFSSLPCYIRMCVFVCLFYTLIYCIFHALRSVFGMLLTLRNIRVYFFGISFRSICCWSFLLFTIFLILSNYFALKNIGQCSCLDCFSFSSSFPIRTYTRTAYAYTYTSVVYEKKCMHVKYFASAYHLLDCVLDVKQKRGRERAREGKIENWDE